MTRLRQLGITTVLSLSCAIPLSAACAQEIQMQDAYFGRSVFESELKEGLSDYRPLGTQVGGFVVFPTIAASVLHNDNIFARDTVGVESDIITVISPALRVASDWERHGLAASARLRHEEYADFDSESVTNGDVALSGTLNIGEFSALKANLRYLNANENRTDALSPTASVERIAFEESFAELQFIRTVNQFRLTAGAGYETQDYDDGFTALGAEIDQDFRDYNKYIYSARLDYAFSPSLAVFTDNAYNITNYDDESRTAINRRDSDGFDTAIGVDFEISDLVRADARVGLFSQSFDSSRFSDTTGLLVAVGADWYVTPLTNLRLDAKRDRNEEATTTGSDSIKNEVELRANHRLMDNVLLEAGARYTSQDFQSIDREDTTYSGSIGARYYFNEHLNISPSYIYGTRTSDGTQAIEDFDRNVFKLTLGAAL